MEKNCPVSVSGVRFGWGLQRGGLVVACLCRWEPWIGRPIDNPTGHPTACWIWCCLSSLWRRLWALQLRFKIESLALKFYQQY